ncbi:MAG: YrhB domain-containing protein [Planctomycetota bacterium]|nr:YrhB domain-containing protein [Planctomycetota bacterium]
MITYADALAIARRYLKEWEHSAIPLRLLEDITMTREFGWVFFYDSAKSVGSNEPGEDIAGNAPIIIDRKDGSLHVTGTGRPIEYFIDNYERTGETVPTRKDFPSPE